MDKSGPSKVIDKWPKEFRELYERSIAQRGKPRPDVGTPSQPKTPHIAPLVNRIAPNTVIGHPAFANTDQERIRINNFIHRVNMDPNEKVIETIIASEKLIVNGWEVFYQLVKDDEDFRKHEDVLGFINLGGNIPKVCACSREQLRGAAASLYGQLLPLLQARDVHIFDKIKQAKNVATIVFQEGDLVLLEV